VVISAGVMPAGAQRDASPLPYSSDIEYDGRFTFVRASWGAGDGWFGRRGGWNAAWNHDYPRAEQNLLMILKELTSIDARTDGSRILSLDDPELFKYPIVFMWEPGFWSLTDVEAEAFRAYLQKGGFAVFEDFDGPSQWRVFTAQMQRVLPDGRFVRLDASHRIFDSFFQIADIDGIVHPMNGMAPSYWGLFENNDPSRRLMAVANFDNDIPEYWEWSGQGFYPFDNTNDAYKLGVNYMIYGMTH
jgi:hypothetical protein